MSVAVASSRHRATSSSAGISSISRPGCHERWAPRRAQLYQLAPIGVFPIAALRAGRHVPPVGMRAALTAAGKRWGQESPGDLHRLIRVEVYVYATARRLAAQQADVLAVGPVVGYLLLGDPQSFPALTAGVL